MPTVTTEITLAGYGVCHQLANGKGKFYVYSPAKKAFYNFNPHSKELVLNKRGVNSLEEAKKLVV